MRLMGLAALGYERSMGPEHESTRMAKEALAMVRSKAASTRQGQLTMWYYGGILVYRGTHQYIGW